MLHGSLMRHGRDIFGGIDLKERLIGAVIIGTGLPQVNTEQEILKEYF